MVVQDRFALNKFRILTVFIYALLFRKKKGNEITSLQPSKSSLIPCFHFHLCDLKYLSLCFRFPQIKK